MKITLSIYLYDKWKNNLYKMDSIPPVGFGTYRLEGEIAYRSVLAALKEGYRHIDTAPRYRNEMEVGRAIQDSGVLRTNIWITTKIPVDVIKKEKSQNSVLKAIRKSLQDLGVEYLDLVLLHGPVHEKVCPKDYLNRNMNAYKILEDVVNGCVEDLKEKVRRIGVSNYRIEHLKHILEGCQIKPYLNQIEVSPYFPRVELVEYCASQGVLVEAHSSLIKGEKFKDDALIKLSNETGFSKPHLLLGWAIDKGFIVIPRSGKLEHIIENKQSVCRRLNETVIHKIDMINKDNKPYFTHSQYV